jgi:hypothetical protein
MVPAEIAAASDNEGTKRESDEDRETKDLGVRSDVELSKEKLERPVVRIEGIVASKEEASP